MTIAPAVLAGGAPLLPRDLGPDRLRLCDVEHVGEFVTLSYSVAPAS